MRLAAQGLRDMDDGPQKIDDVNELAQVRKQARKVAVRSLTVAVVLAIVFAVIRYDFNCYTGLITKHNKR